jgi:positive regulator of sigma E activity
MTRERGVVISIEDHTARVALVQEKIASCGSCGTCGGSCTIAQACFDAPAPEGLRVDDKVAIEIPGPGVALSAALVFLGPAVLFIGAIIGARMVQARGMLPGETGVAVLVAVCLLVLYFAALSLYDRRLRNSPTRQPRIIAWPGHGTQR